jgi:hypothetical protein
MIRVCPQEWTDQRLDDLVKGLETSFNRLDQDIRGVRGEIRALQRGG